MAKAIINQDQLKAIFYFSADKDVRYYLNGVYVESTQTETRLAATDGFTLGVCRTIHAEQGANEGTIRAIIPRDTVKQALAWKFQKTAKTHDLILECPDGYTYENAHAELKLTGPNGSIIFNGIVGEFPDYTRVIRAHPVDMETGKPKLPDGDLSAQFNPEYLMRIFNAAKALGNKHVPAIRHCGKENFGFAVISDNFVAVVMPMRIDAPEYSAIEWARTANVEEKTELKEAA
jgi:DNA polymerase-3 subunit beta